MKTFFTTFILSVISLISFGQYSQVAIQSVTVNFKGDKNYQAIIDGQTYYSDMHFEIEGNGRAHIIEERNRNSWNRGNRRGNRNGGYDNGNGGYGNGNGYPNNRYSTPMADYQFSQVYQAAKGKWFQSAKISAVRDDFNNTSFVFGTFQARQLLLLINSEADRLELAKLAYNNIADPQNFTQLYDIFNSQFSRDELDRYARGNRF